MVYICNQMNTYSLFELNEHLRRVVALNFSSPVWVTAEIVQAQHARAHIYLNLVQYDDSKSVSATALAILWQRDHRRLSALHGAAQLSLVLRAGQLVRLLVQVEFNERFGLRLQVHDVDMIYSEGQMALQRQALLQHLRQSGLLERNRALLLPLSLQRIAVISSDQAAGYQDFIQHLHDNTAGYQWRIVPFFAAVQGQYAPEELKVALLQVAARASEFDAVVVVRGGGSRLDLAAFDHAEVCELAAQLPLPLLTGIGHDVDEAILDQVAHTALKTPTAVADFLVAHQSRFEQQLLWLGEQCRQTACQVVAQEQQLLNQIELTLRYAITQRLQESRSQLDQMATQLQYELRQQIATAHQQLDAHYELVTALHPDRALERGFVWVSQLGRQVMTAAEVQPNVPLVLRWKDGEWVVGGVPPFEG
jgi:exodeoxyribonuclease VII large subunit